MNVVYLVIIILAGMHVMATQRYAVLHSAVGGIRSRSATPRFHDCKYNLHRKVALRTAIQGSSHPRMFHSGPQVPVSLAK